MRDEFLLDDSIVFLNHGSYGACPKDVFADYQRWQLKLERNPVAFLGRHSAELLAHARQVLAESIGASAGDLVFVPNATTGVNTVARSLALQPGDEVLGTDHEYGACDATWRSVCAQHGALYRKVQIPLPYEPERVVERLLAAATPHTRVIFASHISSATALIFPVAQLCAAARERGIVTVIDGAHAPGQVALDLDAIGADFTTGNCHKWLCAPKGAAFLHVRPEHHASIDATVVSWGYAVASGSASVRDAFTGRSVLERRLQWQGTRDITACLAVPAAIAFQQRHGWPAVQQRCHAMALATQARVLARNGLQPVAPDAAYAQMVTIPVHGSDAEGLRQRLFNDHRIEVPVTQHAGRIFVRISVQGYNTQADLDALVGALDAAGV